MGKIIIETKDRILPQHEDVRVPTPAMVVVEKLNPDEACEIMTAVLLGMIDAFQEWHKVKHDHADPEQCPAIAHFLKIKRAIAECAEEDFSRLAQMFPQEMEGGDFH